ncbi:hypothetical protein VNO80_21641 [Phaseolus coccineus]|uniref:Purple acid phosphatase n=1 Tax=Phaseolus coccineus TaxID=3886 RepID=A0AAN9M3M3_PHACN
MQTMLLKFVLASFVWLSSIRDGSAGITSSFVRPKWPSEDMPVDHEVFAIPKGYNAPQQVHITQGDYDGKAVIISWVTPDEAGPSHVQYGTSKDRLQTSKEGTVANYTFYYYKSGYIHHCLIEGLAYNTKYYYRIGSGDSARDFWFQTPPTIGPDTPYKFGIIGDLGQTFNSLSTLEHYLESGGQAVLYVGDLSYSDEHEFEDVGLRWDTWGRFAEKSAAYQPWFWNVGNHEVEFMPEVGEIVPFKNYLYRYTTPYLASNSSSPLWYAVRRASAHIIVLSSYSAFVKYTPQYVWLKKELARVDREKTPWLFVIVHKPLYSSNVAHYMEGEAMRSVFESWFVQYKVDAIFAGHVHAYERSYRYSNIDYNITGGRRYPVPDKSAPIYVTIGDGGNLEGLASSYLDPQPEYSAFREASYGHATLEIKNRTHAVYNWYRNDDGNRVAADSLVLLNQYWESNKGKESAGY